MSRLRVQLRRWAPGVIGVGLATLILWRTGETLERSAEGRETSSFAILVQQPVALIELHERPGTVAAPSWQAVMRPAGELPRLDVTLDGEAIESERDDETGSVEVPLAGLIGAPGWHFVELGVSRRGGRQQRAVAPILLGRFETPTDKPCAASLTASPQLIQDVVTRMLERELLPPLRDNETMGPDTAITTVELSLGDDRVAFAIELAGVNTLAVSGAISVAVVGDRQLHAELAELSEVEFRGQLRNTARGIGAGGGAIVGGLIGGPLAPVGAAAGWYLADKFVTKKARQIVREQVEAGLARFDGVELLPDRIELMRGFPASAVRVGFCEQTGVRSHGLVAGVWIDPIAVDQPRYPLQVPGPLRTGATPTIDALEAGEQLRIELTIDTVNLLLTTWTASGMLADLINLPRALEHANAELEAWTPLRLRELSPTYPPTLTPAGGPADGWTYGLGGLVVEVDGVDAQPWGQIFVSAAGTLAPHWDADAGELSLEGSLDRLDITCARQDADAVMLSGCFSEVLEAAEVRERIDAHLRPGARGLPKLALRELLAESLGLDVQQLAFSRPRPGVLRVAAKT